MTRRARFFALFPAAWTVLVLLALAWVAVQPGGPAVAALIFVVYLLPVACFRLHQAAWPIVEGRSWLDAPEYSPWWGSHQFQVVYSAFPALEALLRLLPGVYSAWLRLWGSRVGRRVHWTPRIEILDRSLIEVGDDVVFGHRFACSAHVITRRGGRLLLYVRRVSIGSRVLLGFACRLAPGVHIDDDVALAARTDVFLGRRIRAGGA